MYIKSLFFSFLFLCFAISGFSQRTVNTQGLYWVKYGASFNLDNGWKIKPSVEDRRYFKNNRQHMWLFNLAAEKQLKNDWALGGGLLKWSILMPSDPESSFETTQHEWRPYQYLSHQSKLSDKWSLKTRLMLEQRIRQNVANVPGEGPQIQDGYYAYLRFRLLHELNYQLPSENTPVSFSVFNEVMVHFGADEVSNMFDQNRMGAKINVGVAKNITATLGYINWYQQLGGTNYVQRNIVMFYLSQKF